ncbi:MAG: hypothetical protein GY757_13315, partial [bacterium]|nr:hypothetical protein [bacterium]
VSTPGNVNAWAAMSNTYGKLEWRRLFQQAIKTAKEGFRVDKRLAHLLKRAFDEFPEHAKMIFGEKGSPLQEGKRLVQMDLAGTMSLISQKGAAVFYKGELGKKIAETMKKNGGFLSMMDLQADKGEWWEPVSIDYRGFKVYTASPPSTAFPSLIRLGIMSRFDVKKLGHNSLEMLHAFIEVTKHAYLCRLRFAGDPEVKPPPLDRLLSEAYWKEQAGKIDLKHARAFTYENIPTHQRHTTHFVVADSKGNIVSATQTLGNLFGSRIMPEGTGLWLNNSLAYCTFEPAGNPMDAHPGRRKLSGDCPTIILKDGKPWAALGTPGGHTIGQTVPQMVMNLIDFNMDMGEAIAAPRVSFTEPDTILVEKGVEEKTIKKLGAMGHKLKLLNPPYGLTNAHGLTIEYDKKGSPVRFTGASDPRGVGLAKGLEVKRNAKKR